LSKESISIITTVINSSLLFKKNLIHALHNYAILANPAFFRISRVFHEYVWHFIRQYLSNIRNFYFR